MIILNLKVKKYKKVKKSDKIELEVQKDKMKF